MRKLFSSSGPRPTRKLSLGFFLRLLFGVGLAAVIAGEVAVRTQIERRYEEALQSREQLALQVTELQTQRERLAASLAQEQQRLQGLAQELSAKDHELQRTLARLGEEGRTIEALEQQVGAMRRQMDLLQGELVLALQSRPGSASTSPQTVQLEKVVVTKPTSAHPSQGRVLSVHPDWKFVVFDLGWDYVRIGDVVSIYRRDQLLGKARVERVQEQAAAATLLPEWERTEIAVNDVVQPF